MIIAWLNQDEQVGSRTAKESRINALAFKNATTTMSILHRATELVNLSTETTLTALILIS